MVYKPKRLCLYNWICIGYTMNKRTQIEKDADQIGKFLVKARKDPEYREKVQAVAELDKYRKNLKSVERVVKPLFRGGSMPCIMLGADCEYWVGKKVVVRLLEE